MVNGSDESDLWSFEGIAAWELSVEEEKAILVWGLLGPEEQNFPEVDVGAREDGNEGMRVFAVVLDLLPDSLQAAIGCTVVVAFPLTLQFFCHILCGNAATVRLRQFELVDSAGKVKGHALGLYDPFFDR